MKTITKTSISLPLNIYKELSIVCNYLGISKEKLLKRILLHFFRYEKEVKINNTNTVQYNPRSSGGHKKLTIRLSMNEYTILQNVRFLKRLSISLISAKAIKKELQSMNKALNRIKKKTGKIKTSFFQNPLSKLKNSFFLKPVLEIYEAQTLHKLL